MTRTAKIFKLLPEGPRRHRPDELSAGASDARDHVHGAFKPALAFHVLTPVYDTVLELLGLGRSFKQGVARLADVRAEETVLDLGCGTGTLLLALFDGQPDAHYVGVDPDPQVLSIAARKLQRAAHSVQLLKAYGQDLPFADRSFDVVVSTLIFHHLSDVAKRATLEEVRRVLRPSGRFLLIDFGPPRSLPAKVLFTVGSFFDGRANTRANLAGEVPTLLREAGFSVEEVHEPHRGVSYLRARIAL